ncbi:tyrosine-type recombinase/integrase [Paenibacillus oleatilyticus]|uniref:tyrosine-type recombinase/integrase n=1 Tax=Paenibacillus oleatilyticus TaxID=2594886 RepID=UPI001C1FE291|nr:tyrosine-type recombinase/integrase [Paenibacillus oleatilyticus]MBU7319529.1 tyrosine-type recombinase/integrase [Paenibacillus oleatilyticus]
MRSPTHNLKPSSKHLQIINAAITSYYENDIWAVLDFPLLNEKEKEKWIETPRVINFGYIQNYAIKNEIKYYFYYKLLNGDLTVTTVWRNYCSVLKCLGNFLKSHFPAMESITELPLEEFLTRFRTYLLVIGKPVTKKRYLNPSNSRWQSYGTSENARLTAFRSIYSFFAEMYDEVPEFEKDRWDIRKLNIDFNITSGLHYLDFTSIPVTFRELCKKYIYERVFLKEAVKPITAVHYLIHLRLFFGFIKQKHSDWTDLMNLSRSDIIEFIKYIRIMPMGGNSAKAGQKPSEYYVYRTLINLEVFLQYIQFFEYEEAPLKNAELLILPEDRSKQKKRKADDLKYIPDYVWEQVVENINFLPSDMVPVFLLMEATGFRICDVLQIKLDCLLEQDDGFWIKGLQRKVKKIDHKVPVSKEIADIVKAQIQFIRNSLSPLENPNNYLFPVLRGKKKGIPPLNSTVIRRLNDMAFKCNIKDSNGELFWFTNHAFRHRYGVTLVNNGMNIVHIQKLMAHACPEITLLYAELLDQTLRKEWEMAWTNKGLRFNPNGVMQPTEKEQHANDIGLELRWIRHNMDSIRLEHGFCIKLPNQHCDFLETTLDPPCIKNKCRSFHVDTTFLAYYQEQINKMEDDINIYKETGRLRSIEIITPKLERYKQIVQEIQMNNGVMGMPKEKRENLQREM